MITAISNNAHNNWMIATPGGYAGIGDLLQFTPVYQPSENKIVYTFHYYVPNEFAQPLHDGRLFPSDPREIHPQLLSESLEEEYEISEYKLNQWDATRISSQIYFAHKWSELHGAPVWCGEFGVKKPENGANNRGTNPGFLKARSNWLSAVRNTLESYGMAWAVWDHSTSDFSISINAVLDPQVEQALFPN